MLRRYLNDAKGVAAVELALLLPILFVLLLGVYETGRFILITQKAEKVVYTVADVVAQSETISAADMQSLLSAVNEMMSPFTFGANGKVIISSVARGTTNTTVRWQYCGGGTLAEPSRIGPVNGTAALPAGFSLNAGDDIVVAEVFYKFTPVLGEHIIKPGLLHRTAYFRPRLGALSDFSSSCQ